MTWLLALLGIALALYGLALFAAFALALRALARVQSTETYAKVRASDPVRGGEALLGRAVEAIPVPFLRGAIQRRIAGPLQGLGLPLIEERLLSSRSLGKWLAIGGGVLFIASFWLGPRLAQAIGL